MRAVIITDNIVRNVVEVPEGWTPASAGWQPAQGFAVPSATAQIGDTYLNGQFHHPPSPEPDVIVPQIISDRQFFQKLAMLGLITEAEALAAVKTGDVPTELQGLIDALPADQRFAAEMLLSGAVSFSRSHPLTLFFGQAMGWSSDQLDELWIDASKL